MAEISLGDGPLSQHLSAVGKLLGESGQRSAYADFVAKLQVGYSWYDDLSWKNLPWLLGSAFSEEELRLLLTEAITTQQADLRGRFPSGGSASKLKGSAADMSDRLSKPEALQILMLASDACIVSAIDSEVQRGRITIPPSETRVAMASAETHSWLGLNCECSQLGVRVVSRGDGTQPLARLRRLVLQMYTSASDRKQLAWMLGRAAAVGGIQEDTLGREVERFILERSPASVLRELIFGRVAHPSHRFLLFP